MSGPTVKAASASRWNFLFRLGLDFIFLDFVTVFSHSSFYRSHVVVNFIYTHARVLFSTSCFISFIKSKRWMASNRKKTVQSSLFTLPRSRTLGSIFCGNDVSPLSSPAASRCNSFRSLFTLPRASAHKIHNHHTAKQQTADILRWLYRDSWVI